MPAWISSVLVVCVSALLMSKVVDVNKIAMRFFRDLARGKARKRLYGNQHALMPILLGIEKPLDLRDGEDDEALQLTLEELAFFNGEEDGTPIYLAISGRIYDVSAGERFYGPGGKYHLFVGKDATRAFATGCLQDTPECVSSSTEGLSDKEMREIQKWLELYDTHDKYTFVGHLISDPIDALLDAAQEAEETSDAAGGVET